MTRALQVVGIDRVRGRQRRGRRSMNALTVRSVSKAERSPKCAWMVFRMAAPGAGKAARLTNRSDAVKLMCYRKLDEL